MTLPPSPAQKLLDAPLGDVVVLLLKQFKRLLDERGLVLTVADMEALGQAATERAQHPQLGPVCDALHELVTESVNELEARFGWTFAESFSRDMSSITTWETTAEFLELANHKSNAELRISAGATLQVLLGDLRPLDHLRTVISVDNGALDVDAVLALRAVAHQAHVSATEQEALHAWLNAH